jgi:glyoxylase-like metal-dependent hydrolase (beta-lactamase superfamily II)
VTAPAAIPLAKGVWRIPTTPADLVNSFAFTEDDGSVTLVDCGYRFGASRRIRAGLAAIGRDISDVQRIVLTHAHSDHAGSAAALVAATGVEGVTLHHDDAGYARRGQSPPRDPAFNGPSWLRRVNDRLNAYPPVTVAGTLDDGDTLSVAGGLQVVHTPGHTPGHVSLLHETSGVLITGDAIWNMRRRITWPVLAFCTNAALTQQTADVLGDLEYTTAAFTHGPQISVSARETVRRFLRTAQRVQ